MATVTFITCVSDWETYDRCRQSIEGLTGTRLAVAVDPVDNRDNSRSCPAALNLGWNRTRSDFIVFCHQDVTFTPEWLQRFDASLDAIEKQDPRWAVLGPMGRRAKRFFGHDFDRTAKETFHGPLPARVDTVDEYCLIVRRELPLRFDERLGGYHLYGVDLCIQATEADRGVWAIDAACTHHSTVRHRPPEYHAIKKRLQRKWRFGRRRVGRSVGTTCGRIRFGLFEGW